MVFVVTLNDFSGRRAKKAWTGSSVYQVCERVANQYAKSSFIASVPSRMGLEHSLLG